MLQIFHVHPLEENWIFVTNKFVTTCNYLLVMNIIGYFCNYVLHLVMLDKSLLTKLIKVLKSKLPT
jgi:hypothetical protein